MIESPLQIDISWNYNMAKHVVGQTKHKLPFSNHPWTKTAKPAVSSPQTQGLTTKAISSTHKAISSTQQRVDTFSQESSPHPNGQAFQLSGTSSPQVNSGHLHPSHLHATSAHKLPSPAFPQTSPVTHLSASSCSHRLDQVVEHLDSSSQQLTTAQYMYGIDRSGSLARESLNHGRESRTYGSPVVTLKESIDNSYKTNGQFSHEDDNIYQIPPTLKRSGVLTSANLSPSHHPNRPLPSTPFDPVKRSFKGKGHQRTSPKGLRPEGAEEDRTSKRLSGRYQNDSPVAMQPQRAEELLDDEGAYQGPVTPMRYDSLRRSEHAVELPEDEEMLNSPWFQKGIPRELALDILAQQEIGSFIVRESTSHKGCYALSVKVPKFDNPAGISHYLIARTPHATYRLKGVDKEWPSLTALVTHHTVMPEMLPCTLRMPRNANNPSYKDCDNGREDEEDYQRLSDFSAMMTDLKM